MELVYSQSRVRQEIEGLPDRELAIQARAGDMLAFEILVARKTAPVLSVAFRSTSCAARAAASEPTPRRSTSSGRVRKTRRPRRRARPKAGPPRASSSACRGA